MNFVLYLLWRQFSITICTDVCWLRILLPVNVIANRMRRGIKQHTFKSHNEAQTLRGTVLISAPKSRWNLEQPGIGPEVSCKYTYWKQRERKKNKKKWTKVTNEKTIPGHSYWINNYNDNIIIATTTAASTTTMTITITTNYH